MDDIFAGIMPPIKKPKKLLGPVPPWPRTGWKPPTEFPNIRHAKWISFDTETWDPELIDAGPGWARGKGHIVGISMSVKGGKWYFPMRHTVEKELNLDPVNVTKFASWALGGPSVKIGANLTYDMGWCREEGIEVNGPVYDPQFAEACLNETSKVNLDALGWKYLRRRKESDLLKAWCQDYYKSNDKDWRKDIWRSPVSLVGPYAEEDAVLPYEVLMEQWPLLHKHDVFRVFDMECRLIRLFIEMRFKGIQVNVGFAEELYHKFDTRQRELQKEADDICGMHFNVNSGDDLAKVFDKFGIPYKKTAEGNPSFTSKFLKAQTHPIAQKVNYIRQLGKLQSTFIKSYLIDSHVNGKVYCSFNQMSGTDGGARTGRLACSDPNLQNIPVRTDEGKMIRQAFIMDHGHEKLRDYDYSQIEYRMLAHFATGPGSDDVRNRYIADPTLDYHKMIGAMILEKAGVELERSYIKNINFGIVYGMQLKSLCEFLNVTREKGISLLDTFHSVVTFAKPTMDGIADDTGATGIVRTILGRTSHFDLWEPRKRTDWTIDAMPYDAARTEWGTDIVRAYLYRALNYKLQGSAADVMKMSMLQCYESGIYDVIGVPRLTVHDELLWSDPGGTPQEAWDEMKRICETSIPVSVPLLFEAGEGLNWGEAH